jgi:hypothetical protein
MSSFNRKTEGKISLERLEYMVGWLVGLVLLLPLGA